MLLLRFYLYLVLQGLNFSSVDTAVVAATVDGPFFTFPTDAAVN
jgi:hypothetical protein